MEKTPEEAFEWVNSLGSRKKKLDPYKDWIIAWLQEYPHLNASQIQDWLLEKFPDFTVGESTMRLYVNQIREEYQIAKTKVVRQYEAVEEQPMGKHVSAFQSNDAFEVAPDKKCLLRWRFWVHSKKIYT